MEKKANLLITCKLKQMSLLQKNRDCYWSPNCSLELFPSLIQLTGITLSGVCFEQTTLKLCFRQSTHFSIGQCFCEKKEISDSDLFFKFELSSVVITMLHWEKRGLSQESRLVVHFQNYSPRELLWLSFFSQCIDRLLLGTSQLELHQNYNLI